MRKNISKEEKEEILGEDEETWVWDEKYLETMYRIPTFRRKLEHLLESMAEKNPKQKKAMADKVRQFLERPKQLLGEILNSFWNRLNTIASIYFYLDTRERQIIETFDQRLIEYWRILNTLLRKAGEILGEKQGYYITHHREHKPENITSEVLIENVALPEAYPKTDSITDIVNPQDESATQIIPEKPIAKIPQNVIIPLKEKPESTEPARTGTHIEAPQKRVEINDAVTSSDLQTQVDAQKTEIFKRVVEIIRREKKISVSKTADTFKVPSKMIWACLVDLDIEGGFESEFDGETFILMSEVSKFNAVIEEKIKHQNRI